MGANDRGNGDRAPRRRVARRPGAGQPVHRPGARRTGEGGRPRPKPARKNTKKTGGSRGSSQIVRADRGALETNVSLNYTLCYFQKTTAPVHGAGRSVCSRLLNGPCQQSYARSAARGRNCSEPLCTARQSRNRRKFRRSTGKLHNVRHKRRVDCPCAVRSATAFLSKETKVSPPSQLPS